MKPQMRKSLSRSLMLHFYNDHLQELLPIVLKDGLSTFSRRFCELHQTQPGQYSGPALDPKHVEETFRGYFTDHEEFYTKYVLTAFNEVGGNDHGLKEEDIDTFYEIINDRMKDSKLVMSENLHGSQFLIITKMVLPSTEKEITNDSEFKSEMFPENETVAVATEITETVSESETTADEVVTEEVNPSEAKPEIKLVVGRPSNPLRVKSYEVMNPMLMAAYHSHGVAPTNSEVREAIIAAHPDMADWVANERKWISKILSAGNKVLGLQTDDKRKSNKQSVDSERDDSKNQASRSRKTEDPKTSKNPERVKARKVIEKYHCQLRYKKPKFYTIAEIVEKIAATYPTLTEWLQDGRNRKYISVTLASMKLNFLQAHPEYAHNAVLSPKSTAATVEPKASPKPTPASTLQSEDQGKMPVQKIKEYSKAVASNQLVDDVVAMLAAMKTGLIPPVTVIEDGTKLYEEFQTYVSGLNDIKFEFEQSLSRYRKLFSNTEE